MLRSVVATGIAFVVFWLWFFACSFWIHFSANVLTSYFGYSVVVCMGVFWERILRRRPLPHGLTQSSVWNNVVTGLRQAGIGILLLVAFLFLTKDHTASRLFVATLAPVLAAVLAYNHRVITPLVLDRVMRGRESPETLLVGDLAMLRRHLAWLDRHQEQGLDFIGIVAPRPKNAEEEISVGIDYLGEPEELEDVMRTHAPSAVMFFDTAGSSMDFLARKRMCDRFGARYLHVWDFGPVSHLVPKIDEREGLHLFSFREEPLQDPFNQLLKKALDFCIALPVVVFVLPLMSVFVWIFQSIQSPGPLFFIQERTGLHGRVFKIIKYRTMHTGDFMEAKQATIGDSRIYPAGAWFRKLSIDEFPQFINVLLGDMSIIGPRPHLPAHDLEFAKISEPYRVRTLVRPGITGLAQVRGERGLIQTDSDVSQRVDSDLFYVENWSLMLDLLILVQTVRNLVIPPKSAH
jgi:exopolysaccharide biosynthesis polyprenyl glycosylphosphotransferase